MAGYAICIVVMVKPRLSAGVVAVVTRQAVAIFTDFIGCSMPAGIVTKAVGGCCALKVYSLAVSLTRERPGSSTDIAFYSLDVGRNLYVASFTVDLSVLSGLGTPVASPFR